MHNGLVEQTNKQKNSDKTTIRHSIEVFWEVNDT